MKMAKASEADLNMAMTLANYCDAISCGHMPDDLSADPGSIEWLDSQDQDQYERLIEGMRKLLNQGSLFRVVFGMAVVCDPANQCIDPDSDVIEHHPMRQLLERQRDDAVKQAAAVNEQFIEISRQRDELLAVLSDLTSTVGLAIDGANGWDAHKNARKLLTRLKGGA